jgi:hypothetical protein
MLHIMQLPGAATGPSLLGEKNVVYLWENPEGDVTFGTVDVSYK